MIRLHKITFRKLLSYPTFWILLGLHLILCNLIVLGLEGFLSSIEINGNKMSEDDLSRFGLFAFPGIWHNITYVAGYFKFILALIIIIDASNDFSYRTIRQHIIDGLSFTEYLGSKLILIFWMAFISTLFLFITGLYLGFSHTESVSFNLFSEKLAFLGGYFVQLMSYLSLALLIAIVVKRSGLSIGLLLLYTFIIEPLVAYFFPDFLQRFLPLENLSNMIQVPFKELFGETGQEQISIVILGIAIIYIVLFNLFSYLLIKYKDVR